MTDTPTPAPGKPRRWPLYVSLFLNVVLVTVLAFGAWRIHQFRETFGAEALGPWMPRQVERVLPPQARDKVVAIRKAHADAFRPLFEKARAARREVRQALEAEPFVPGRLGDALRTMREADSAVAEATAGMIVEIATVLTPEERAMVRKAMRDRHGARGDRGPGGPGGLPDEQPDGPPPGPPPAEPPPPPPPGGP